MCSSTYHWSAIIIHHPVYHFGISTFQIGLPKRLIDRRLQNCGSECNPKHH